MSGNSFFDEAKEQSEIKTAIVTKYFWAWAKVIMPTAKRGAGKIAYIDLFAGPGRYGDGTISTPLLVLQEAIKDDDMREMLVALFNDADGKHVRQLEEAIGELPDIHRLRHRPQVMNQKVGTEIVAKFEEMKPIPTLFFVDPWGYKGLSLRLINSVLRNWGSDCIFFFNYNRISMGLTNPFVVEHMNALFGQPKADQLRAALGGLNSEERELAIIEALCDSLREMGGRYTLPFRFKHPSQGRTSHHLIFVSKHVRGYSIMKRIMATESSEATQGVPSFEYNPAMSPQGLLFELSRPLDDLRGMLLTDFAGRKLSFDQIFDEHHVNKPFLDTNYRDVLGSLESDGKIVVDRPKGSRRTHKGKPAFGKNVTITFPRKDE